MPVWRKNVPYSRRFVQVAVGALALLVMLFLVDAGLNVYWDIQSDRVVASAEKWQRAVENELRRDERFRGVQIRLPKRYTPHRLVSLRVSVDGWVLENHEVAEVEAIVHASSPPATPSFMVSGCSGDIALYREVVSREGDGTATVK